MQVLTPRSSRWRCRRPRHSCWIASYALLGGAACCWTLTQASLLREFPTRCSVVRACCLYSSVRPSVCLCCAPRVLVLVRIVCRRALVLVLRSLCARAVLVPCLCCGVLVFCVRGCVVPRVLARVCVWAGVPLACRRRLHRRSHLRPPPWSERPLSWPHTPEKTAAQPV